MKLMTDELRKKLPRLYTTDGKDLKDIPVIVKFFNPVGAGTWYAVEFDGEDIFFGLANILEPELGYFSLAELERTRVGPDKVIKLERDLFLGEISLAEAMKREGMNVLRKKDNYEEIVQASEEADAHGSVTSKCDECGLEIIAEPDAGDAYCESCKKEVKLSNPLVDHGLI